MTWLKEIQDDSGILLFNARDYPRQSIGIYTGNGKTAVMLGLDGVTVWMTVDELARFAEMANRAVELSRQGGGE